MESPYDDEELLPEKVGYKSPPTKYWFKKGSKPPPRKKNRPQELDASTIFWRVLQEPRRGIIEGKVRWATTSELLVRRAFNEAEKGSSTLLRLLNDLLFKGEPEGDETFLDYGDGVLVPFPQQPPEG